MKSCFTEQIKTTKFKKSLLNKIVGFLKQDAVYNQAVNKNENSLNFLKDI
jgi:hypothetical protein